MPVQRWLCAVMVAAFPCAAFAATFNVDSNGDAHDATPGDGICATSTQTCTLRAALEESNALAGADTVNLPAGTYTPTLPDQVGFYYATYSIKDSVTINGAAQASTIVDGGSLSGSSVFAASRCVNEAVAGDGSCSMGTVTVQMNGVTVRNGKGSSGSSLTGGAFSNDADLTINDSSFVNNRVAADGGRGGAIYNSASGRLTVNRALFDGNTAGEGGAIDSVGALAVDATTFHANSAPHPVGGGVFYGGGAIFIGFGGAGQILDSTFAANSAYRGGAITVGGAALNVVNTTVSGNSASQDGGGIAIVHLSAVLDLRSSTIAQNRANDCVCGFQGGGIANSAQGSLRLQNSVLVSNSYTLTTTPTRLLQLDECSGNVGASNSLLTSHVNTGYCTVSGTYLTSDTPGLGPLQDNGGPTQTHALLAGSPAIGASPSAACTDGSAPLLDDQRGLTRPHAPVCDIGAVEELVFRGTFDS